MQGPVIKNLPAAKHAFNTACLDKYLQRHSLIKGWQHGFATNYSLLLIT
jgi:hypothetical protein